MSDLSSFTTDLTCSVCLEIFHDPLTLSCQHSFCKLCLQLIQDKNHNQDTEAESPSSEPPDEINCPDCRQSTVLGEGGIGSLPINFNLRNLSRKLKEVQSPKNPKPIQVPCSLCEDTPKPAVKSCEDCNGLNYCQECLEQFHPQRGALKTHTLTEPQNVAVVADSNLKSCPLVEVKNLPSCRDTAKTLVSWKPQSASASYKVTCCAVVNEDEHLFNEEVTIEVADVTEITLSNLHPDHNYIVTVTSVREDCVLGRQHFKTDKRLTGITRGWDLMSADKSLHFSFDSSEVALRIPVHFLFQKRTFFADKYNTGKVDNPGHKIVTSSQTMTEGRFYWEHIIQIIVNKKPDCNESFLYTGIIKSPKHNKESTQLGCSFSKQRSSKVKVFCFDNRRNFSVELENFDIKTEHAFRLGMLLDYDKKIFSVVHCGENRVLYTFDNVVMSPVSAFCMFRDSECLDVNVKLCNFMEIENAPSCLFD